MGELTPLEQAVLRALLDGQHPALEALRDQLPGLGVMRREGTRTRFATILCTSPDAPRAPIAAGQVVLDDLLADAPALDAGAAFALFIEQGRMVRLEGSTFDGEPWPEDLSGFTLHHADPERDLSDLDPPLPCPGDRTRDPR